MAIMHSIVESYQVKVAVVFQKDGIKPVWFQAAGAQPLRVEEVCAIWYGSRGESRIMNFEVGAGGGRWSLSYDTLGLSWSLGRTVVD